MRKPHFFLTYLLVFSLFTIFSVSSCTQDDLIANILEDATTEESSPDPADPTSPTDPITTKPITDLVINTTPCDYTLEGIAANTVLDIECRLDLGGKTIDLPDGVTLNFKGGEIINGTLNFASAGKIDGDLLNYQLQVTGVVSLINEVFQLQPSRWELVQGKTTSEIAQKNNNNLEGLMEYTKSLGATTFSIDKFDAYFEVAKVTSTATNANFYPGKEGINIPGDFTLLMSDNTILRVYPNNNRAYALIALREVSNVTVRGGVLIGDRDEHIFTGGDTHEQGHLFFLEAATDSKIDGVTMKYANGDGMKIQGLKFSFSPDHQPTRDIVVQNCTFDTNRRNNLSITAGYNIIVENNTFLNAGVDTGKSKGTNPKFAIDVEPTRKSDGNGGYIYYEKAFDIIIKGNVERGSVAGAVTVYTGENITIDNNDVENGLSWGFASGVKIINNLLTAKTANESYAILGGRSTSNVENYTNNEISGNKIIGYNTGITIHNGGNIISNNEVINCGVAISLRDNFDTKIHNNKISSNQNLKLENSRGIVGFRDNINDIEIYKNTINTKNDPIRFTEVNNTAESEGFVFQVYENNFSSSVMSTINKSSGIEFSKNNFNNGTILFDSSNISFDNNVVKASTTHGFELRSNTKDILFNNNSIDVNSNKECITADASSSFRQQNTSCL